MKRVGVYLRVSTQEQSTELQQAEITQFLVARDWNTNVRIYSDKATGTNGNREALKLLMKDARSRKIDLIICWKLDRMYRSLRDLLTTLQELQDLGIEFVSLRDAIDMTTASGRLMMQMIGAFSEFEASLIKQRVIAGLANARRKGIKLGRPSTVDTNQAAELRSQGLSLAQISKQLQCSRSAVHKTLLKRVP